MSLAQDLANALHRFNAKERNFLMRFALLGEIDPGELKRSTTWVSPVFFQALRVALESSPTEYGSTSPIKLGENPQCIYAAMDYHLEWLHAALWSVRRPASDGKAVPIWPDREGPIRAPEQFDIMGNQEDADLVVVIEDRGHAYLVLIEAKGDSSFSRTQLASKLTRLKLILDRDHVPSPAELTFALVLLAPEDKLTLGGCASFPALAEHPSALEEWADKAMRNPPERLGQLILRMPMPNFPNEIDLVTRCEGPEGTQGQDPDSGIGDRLKFWKVAPRRRRRGKADPGTGSHS